MKLEPLARPKQKPSASVRTISWVEADRWLLANNKNRTINPAAVKRFRALIQRQEWILGESAVVIDREGFIRNGQHRLEAISDERASDLPILVLEGVDADDRWQYDQGRKRGASDLLAMKGKIGSDQHVAVAKKMVLGERTFRTPQEAVNFTVNHWESIAFALRPILRRSNDPSIRGLARTGLAAAVARAHACGCEIEGLLHFTETVLNDGIGRRFNERDKSLRWLREYVVSEWNTRGSRLGQSDVFWATQTVLYHWLNGEAFDHETMPTRHLHLFTSAKFPTIKK